MYYLEMDNIQKSFGDVEVLKDIIGTKFDKTIEFLEKYKDEGFIWYFDVFSMTSEGLYNTLLQFKNAGWFKYAKAVVIGKVCFPNTFTDMSYEDAIKKSLEDVKCIFNFDIGHVKPSFTMINGMKARVVSNAREGYLRNRLLLSRSSQGKGAHPYSDVRSPHQGGY